jgi:hypothetical protein
VGYLYTILIWSFLTLLAIARSWESELKLIDVIDVVKLLIDFRGFGNSEDAEDVEP